MVAEKKRDLRKRQRLVIDIHPRIKEALHKKCFTKKTSMSQMIRQLIVKELARTDKRRRAA